MSDTPTVVEVDCTTGQVTERPMTEEEISNRIKQAEDYQKQLEEYEAEKAAKDAAKQSAVEKLSALGLTADEIAALSN